MSVQLTSALTTPQGIAGRVVDLDGTTAAPAGTPIKATNLNTGYALQGITGRGSDPGGFVLTLPATEGDIVQLESWTLYAHASRNITVHGFMKNVLIALNLSVPNTPPEIVSVPLTIIFDTQEFRYDLVAVDPDNDTLTYELTEAPLGAVVYENGTIIWTPTGGGNYSFTVAVSDGVYVVNQSFTVEVVWGTHEPVFLTTPRTDAYIMRLYYYLPQVTDLDNDTLTFVLGEHPKGMHVHPKTGYVYWRPSWPMVGKHVVELFVTDGTHKVNQTFYVRVHASPYTTTTFASSQTGTGHYLETEEDDVLQAIGVQYTTQKTAPQIYVHKTKRNNLPTLQKTVFTYLYLEPEDTDVETVSLTYAIEKEWLQEYGFTEEEVQLYGYETDWQPVVAQKIEETDTRIIFTTEGTSFTSYAIAGNDQKYPALETQILPDVPGTVVLQIVDKNGKSLQEGTMVVLTVQKTKEQASLLMRGPYLIATLDMERGDLFSIDVEGITNQPIVVEYAGKQTLHTVVLQETKLPFYFSEWKTAFSSASTIYALPLLIFILFVLLEMIIFRNKTGGKR